jgi:DNA repair protein RecO (recombination protein O)
MIFNTRGIVLSTVRYSDSAVIARVYTESSGLRAFLIRTGKGKTALSKLAVLQPLSLVELSFNADDRKGLRTPRSLEREYLLNGIPFDTVKTCIALFMAEVVSRSIGEEERNEPMFQFLHTSVCNLDAADRSVVNYHLKFMVEFSRFLGFYPHHRRQGQHYFDLMEGEFCALEPPHGLMMSRELSNDFESILECPKGEEHLLKIDSTQRRKLLQKLIDYYRLHLDGMREITSHRVLEEVLS